MASKFLEAAWRKLVLVNYAVDPSILLPYLPYKTEPDTWNGKHYVSLVGFMFMNTRLKGIPIPFHRNFKEVNLRFYVKYQDNHGIKRGVTFIREIVPKWALTLVANMVYGENYVTLPMKHSWKQENNIQEIAYAWKKKGKWNQMSVHASTEAGNIETGSKEEFITEHFWGYTKSGHSSSSEYGVEHPRWQVYDIKNHQIDVDFDTIYGREFGFLSTLEPESVMLAEGSDIIVRSMKKIK